MMFFNKKFSLLVWSTLLSVFLFSNLVQAVPPEANPNPESDRVTLSATFPDQKMRWGSFWVSWGKRQAKQLDNLLQSLGISLDWDSSQGILKVNASPVRQTQKGKSPTSLKIETELPVELEGECLYALTLVSQGARIRERWSSPALTLIPSKNFSAKKNSYGVDHSGLLMVTALSLLSGEFLNEGRILSSGPLELNLFHLKNRGLIESQGTLYFKGSQKKKKYFSNLGRVIAPEIEVGKPLELFYSFENKCHNPPKQDSNLGLIHAKQFLADVDSLSNSSEIQISELISMRGFQFDNRHGNTHSGGKFFADFDQVLNAEGSFSGRTQTELTLRKFLDSLQGEVGTVSPTHLTWLDEAQSQHLGKVQGTDLVFHSNQKNPMILKEGELSGTKSISISSQTKVSLPHVQLHTPTLHLSVPDFALDEQKDAFPTVVHCDPKRPFSLTSPYCTQGNVLFLQSSFHHRSPQDANEPRSSIPESPQESLQKRFQEIKKEVGDMQVYFKRDAGRTSAFKVSLRANLKSSKDIEFIAPLASLYFGDGVDGTEVGIEAQSLRAWTNFLFLLDGHVASGNANIHAPGGLRVGRLIEHPTDRVQVGNQSFPLLCRNSAVWATQNQTSLQGPLHCDGSMEIGGDLVLCSEKEQTCFSPDVRVQGDFVLQDRGDLNILRHLGEQHPIGPNPLRNNSYSVPGTIRVEKAIRAEKPARMRLYATTLYADAWNGDLVKPIDFTASQEIQFPGEAPKKEFRASLSSRKGGVVRLEGRDNEGIISSPKLFLVEKKGQFYLATKNPYYLNPKNPLQDLMAKGFQINTTYLTPDLQEAMRQAAAYRFHFSLREHFFFNRPESEKFYEGIQDHVVVFKPGQGLFPLSPGQVVFSLSPQFLLKQVQDSCQENLMRGYLYEDRPLSMDLLAELHRNATDYVTSLGAVWNRQSQGLRSEQNILVALQQPSGRQGLPSKPLIFYQQVVGEKGIEELKPFFYLPPHFLEKARAEQTGNVFASILGRFPEGTTADEMLDALSEESGVRKALLEFFEANPKTKRAVTQAALRHCLEYEPESGERDSVALEIPIQSPHFAVVVEEDVELKTNLRGKSGEVVSQKGSITLGSQKSRHGEGGNFTESISEQRTLTFEGHLGLRAGKDIRMTAVDLTSKTLKLDAKGNVIDAAIFLDSAQEATSGNTTQKSTQRKAHVSHFQVEEGMEVQGGKIVLEGTQADAGSLRLQAQGRLDVLGVQEESHCFKKTEEETGCLFWKGKKTETHSESHSQFVPAQLRSRGTVGMGGSEVALEAPRLYAQETKIQAKKVRILQGKSSSQSSSFQSSKNPFWMKVSSAEARHEAHTQLDLQGKLKIEAETLELEQVKGRVLDYLGQLEFDPEQVKVVHQLLEEFHHTEKKSISAPGPALVAAVAVVSSLATAGVGGAAVAGVGIKAASLVGTLSSAAISSLTSRITTQLILGTLAQQNPEESLKKALTLDTLKETVTSALTAGTLSVLHKAQAAASTSDFLRRVESSAAQAGIGMTADLVCQPENLGEALQRAGVQFASQVVAGSVAQEIGDHFSDRTGFSERSLHKLAHGISAAAVAGGGAALLGQDVGAAASGAVAGAMISEIVAESLFEPLEEDTAREVNQQEAELGRALTEKEAKAIWDAKREGISRIAHLTGAVSGLLTGSGTGVHSASSAAQTAIENNFEITAEKHWSWKSLQERKGQLAALAAAAACAPAVVQCAPVVAQGLAGSVACAELGPGALACGAALASGNPQALQSCEQAVAQCAGAVASSIVIGIGGQTSLVPGNILPGALLPTAVFAEKAEGGEAGPKEGGKEGAEVVKPKTREMVDAGGANVPVGRRGEPIEVQSGTNQPTTINGRQFTGHALDRMQGRGIPPSAVEEAIQNGISKPGKGINTIEHIIPGVKVITNIKGDVVTVIPK